MDPQYISLAGHFASAAIWIGAGAWAVYKYNTDESHKTHGNENAGIVEFVEMWKAPLKVFNLDR